MTTDTIFALASGRPPAAISVIRISGPRAHAAGTALAGDLPPPRQAAVRELRRPADAGLLDEALVLRFDAPASATAEDVVELHCHGGRAVVDAVLSALSGIDGLRAALPGEFTRRAFENGRIDLTEAEGLADLLEAETESQRRAALAVADGGLRRLVEGWRETLLALSARAEAAIDYDDEADVTPDNMLQSDCDALARDIGSWLQRPRSEPLRDGVRVVVAGPPNVGKSSLVNAIAGSEKAIVTDIPGTTRDQIEVPLSVDGVPILLLDTAGIRETAELVERIGVRRARESARAADILVWLGDAADAPDHAQRIFVQSKADLGLAAQSGSLPVSAVTGQGIADLMRAIAERSSARLPAADAVAFNRRQAKHLDEACAELTNAVQALDLPILADHLRMARSAFDRLTGQTGVEDVLDALFGRFCLGK